jgi:uncharacterized protein YndB with AHSA1/START domain
MDEKRESEGTPMKNPTTVERKSDRELVVTRTVNGPAHLVFEAWTKAELFKKWWVPKSFGLTLLSCELDVRVGGKYRLVFSHQGSTMDFFGTYLEVTPPSRLVWTNEEGDGQTVTTVTLTETGGKTQVVVSDLYPSKQALDEAIANGSTGGLPEQPTAPDELLSGTDPTPGPIGPRPATKAPPPSPPRNS